MPARNATSDPNELVKVAYIDEAGNRYPNVELPRRLVSGGSRKAKERHLISTNQIPDPDAPELPQLVDEVKQDQAEQRLTQQGEAVATLRKQLDELQSKLDGQPLSMAELVDARQDLQAYMLKAADANAQLTQVEGRGSAIKADLTAIATPLNEQAAATQALLDEAKQLQEQVLSDLQAQTANELARFKLQGNEAIDDIEGAALKRAESVARSQADVTARDIANQHWGSSVTIAAENPTKTEDASWAQRHYGRDFLIPGDGAFVTSKDGIQPYRYTGQEWLAGAKISERIELVNQKLSVLDNSTKVTTTQSIARTGGGSSGSGERLIASQLTSSWADVSTSDRWVAAGVTPDAGGVILAITAVDGSSSGQRGFVDVKFVMTNGVVDLTVYSMMGQLFTSEPSLLLEVDVIQRGAVTVPPGITVTPLPGNPLAVRARVLNGTATTYLLEGYAGWTLPASGGATETDEPSSNQQPAWNI